MASTPTKVAPKGQKKCGMCYASMSQRDPHLLCKKCGPRLCSRKDPCDLCFSLKPSEWDAWEAQASKTKPYARKSKVVVSKVKELSGGAKKKSPPANSTKGGKGSGGGGISALSSRVDKLASGMEIMMKMLLEKAQTPSSSVPGSPLQPVAPAYRFPPSLLYCDRRLVTISP